LPKEEGKAIKQDEVVEKDENSPDPMKCEVNQEAVEADRIIAAEQKRLANSFNKHIAATGKWNFLKVAKGSAKVHSHATKVTTLKT
jgi:hypothetical protein